MKPKISLLTFAVTVACTLSIFAQDAAAPAPTVPSTAEANTPADTTSGSPVVATATDGSSTNIIVTGSEVIPLIVMDDVPLTDAIRNLARQAGLNYMLDPKIVYGQPGPDGKVAAQPMVSLRWEKVTAQQALSALLVNYNLQITQDLKTKISRITVKDPAAPDPQVTRVFQLKYANPTNMLENISTALTDKRSKAVADARTSQVVILATEKELANVEKLIDDLDTQTKQVLIEARLVETSMNPSTIKGLNWSGTLTAQRLSFGNNLQKDSGNSMNNTLATKDVPKMLFDTAKGFNPATAFLDADGVSAVLSFMNQYSEAKVLSSPRAVTLDNETAYISVSRAEPIFKNTAGTQGSPGGSEVTYTNLGVLLNVTPRISANNYVNLRVTPEVSRVFATREKVVAGEKNQADAYDIRKIDTHVMIPSGNTLVLGGLITDDIRKSNSKVPLLGDIPILGSAFRSDSKSREKGNLIIFITPTIVQDEHYHPTKTTFLDNQIPPQDSLEADWSAFDTGKPAKEMKKEKAEKEAAFSEASATTAQ